ncbi:MAG: hypothetical protein H7Y02_10965 [Candidatus Obscuribacterales bacterium]|nr:hypothetical protein [Steroidobacteraceae bacterium]
MKMFSKAMWVTGVAVLSMAVAHAADVTGTWNMTVESPAGTGNPVFVLTQKGEAVTGTYKGQLGEAPVTGTVKGNAVALSYKVAAQDMQLKVDYTGTVEGKTMSGKLVMGEMGEGTFKGTKQ